MVVKSRRLCDSSRRSSNNGGSLDSSLDSSSGGSSRSISSRLRRSDSRSSGSLVGWAIPGNVASLSTLVADFTGRAERASIGSSAVTGDMTELATGIALHSLSLAVTGKVVWTTALVAGGSTRVAAKAAAEALETSTRTTSATTSAGGSGIRAVTLISG